MDKCFWKNKIINYKESELTFLFNSQKLDKNLTILECGIGVFAKIYVFEPW